MATVEWPQRKELKKFVRKWGHAEGSNYRGTNLCLPGLYMFGCHDKILDRRTKREVYLAYSLKVPVHNPPFIGGLK